MRHLDEGTIHAWLDGALNEEKARQAEEHAARCTQCATAVADARGFIAASSRILLALDDVPRGVVPKDAGSALGARRSAELRTATTTAPSKPLYQPWMLKVAASIVVVVATGVLITRSPSSLRRPEKAAEARTDLASAANRAPRDRSDCRRRAGGAGDGRDERARARARGRQEERIAPQGEERREHDGLRLRSEARRRASAQRGAAARAGGRSRRAPASRSPRPPRRKTDTAPVTVTDQVATVAPKLAVAPPSPLARGAAAGAPRSIGGQDAVLPPGMRIVSEQTVTAQARVVQKRVYEVSPGVEVTYSIFAPAPARDRRGEQRAGERQRERGEGRERRQRGGGQHDQVERLHGDGLHAERDGCRWIRCE